MDGDALVSYIPPKDMINSSFEEMYEEDLKILSIHIIYAPTTMYNKDEFVKSGGERRIERSWGKWWTSRRGWTQNWQNDWSLYFHH